MKMKKMSLKRMLAALLTVCMLISLLPTMAFAAWKPCPACGGSGDLYESCPDCGGNGRAMCSACGGSGIGSSLTPCMTCLGRGEVEYYGEWVTCPECGGEGGSSSSCGYCDGDGSTTCEGCYGSGMMLAGDCPVCDGNGIIPDSVEPETPTEPETPEDDTRENLALGKTVVASSNDGQRPENAVDGIRSTRWSSSYTNQEWIYVDLGQTYLVGEIRLIWEVAFGTKYTIDVSSDAENWKIVYTQTEGKGGTETITIDPVAARYVRMSGIQRATQWGYSLWEFEVYGSIHCDGHIPVSGDKAPTCTEPGRENFTVCSKCGSVLEPGSELLPLGHSLELIPAKEATEEEAGNNAYYRCTRCDSCYKDEAATVKTTPEQETTRLSAVWHTFSPFAEFVTAADEEDYPWVDAGTYGYTLMSSNHEELTGSLLTIMILKNCVMSFDYAVSSFPHWDHLTIMLNEEEVVSVSGEEQGRFSEEMKPGDVVFILFNKYSDESAGSDCALLKNFRIYDINHEHVYENSICTICGIVHDYHNYGSDGICTVCGFDASTDPVLALFVPYFDLLDVYKFNSPWIPAPEDSGYDLMVSGDQAEGQFDLSFSAKQDTLLRFTYQVDVLDIDYLSFSVLSAGQTKQILQTRNESGCFEWELKEGEFATLTMFSDRTENSAYLGGFYAQPACRHNYEHGVCSLCGKAHQDHAAGSDSVCPVCGAPVVNMSHGEALTLTLTEDAPCAVIYDCGGPDSPYESNCSDTLTIAVPDGSSLRLTGSLLTEARRDILTVYAGDLAAGNPLASYSGMTMIDTVFNGTVTLQFASDSSANLTGFGLNARLNAPTDLPHQAVPGESTATCTEPGLLPIICKDCGRLIRFAGKTDPLGHALELIPAKAPTAATPGNNAYYRCTRCGQYFRDKDAVTATTPEAESVQFGTFEAVFVPVSEYIRAENDATFPWGAADNSSFDLMSLFNHEPLTSTITITALKHCMISFDYAVTTTYVYGELLVTVNGETVLDCSDVPRDTFTVELQKGDTLLIRYVNNFYAFNGNERAYVGNFTAVHIHDFNESGLCTDCGFCKHLQPVYEPDGEEHRLICQACGKVLDRGEHVDEDRNKYCDLCNVKLFDPLDAVFGPFAQWIQAVNDDVSPWVVSDKEGYDLKSTNHGLSTTGCITISVKQACDFSLDYYVSSETMFDELIITVNGDNLLMASGDEAGTFLYDLSAGDVLSIAYKKDLAGSAGEDTAYVGRIQVKAPHGHDYENGVCTICGKTHTGHTFVEGYCSVCSLRDLFPVLFADFAAFISAENDSACPWLGADSEDYALMSSNHASDTESTITLTAKYACSLTFNWAVSSEENYDTLIIRVNDLKQGEYSGTDAGTCSLMLEKGDVLTLTYGKDDSNSNGSDCAYIGNFRAEVIAPLEETLRFTSASVTLKNSLALNFYVAEKILEGYTDPFVVFTKEIYAADGSVDHQEMMTVDTAVLKNGSQVFTYPDIAANEMNSLVRATLYGTKDGVLVKSSTICYSVQTYAMSLMRNANSSIRSTLLRKTLVSLLNYGAAAQIYTDYRTDALANAVLSDADQALVAGYEPVYESHLDITDSADSPVHFNFVTLTLGSSIAINYYPELEGFTGSLNDVYLKVTWGDREYIIDGRTAAPGYDGMRRLTFDQLDATQLRTPCVAQFFSKADDSALSETLTYSVVTYAQMLESDSDALAVLTRQMLVYGDFAAGYFGR